MPVKHLPRHPSLGHLRHQAKDLLRMHAGRDLQSAQRVREFHPRFHGAPDEEIFNAPLRLSDAQLSLAREYGFENWAKLKEHVETPALTERLGAPYRVRIADDTFRQAVDLLDKGDAEGLRAHLAEHTGLIHQRVEFPGGNYFRNPTLLEFVAENPVRRGTLPANIIELTRVILDAGAKRHAEALTQTLALVSSGRVARECGAQVPLINLLCEYGASADGAMRAGLAHGEMEVVRVLIARGAEVDLPAAAAMGLTEAACRLISSADRDSRHRALALASQFGHIEIVRLLLDIGEDPNRYNPIGFHWHSTPLHQAAWAGHEQIVELLLERGGRTDLRDTLWQGTPADWASHAGQKQIESYLRAQKGNSEG